MSSGVVGYWYHPPRQTLRLVNQSFLSVASGCRGRVRRAEICQLTPGVVSKVDRKRRALPSSNGPTAYSQPSLCSSLAVVAHHYMCPAECQQLIPVQDDSRSGPRQDAGPSWWPQMVAYTSLRSPRRPTLWIASVKDVSSAKLTKYRPNG